MALFAVCCALGTSRNAAHSARVWATWSMASCTTGVARPQFIIVSMVYFDLFVNTAHPALIVAVVGADPEVPPFRLTCALTLFRMGRVTSEGMYEMTPMYCEYGLIRCVASVGLPVPSTPSSRVHAKDSAGVEFDTPWSNTCRVKPWFTVTLAGLMIGF